MDWALHYIALTLGNTILSCTSFFIPQKTCFSRPYCTLYPAIVFLLCNFIRVIHKLRWQVFGFFYHLPTIIQSCERTRHLFDLGFHETLQNFRPIRWHFPRGSFNYVDKICQFDPRPKVIHTKYCKHWPDTVAHIIDCVCSKINSSWFNPWFSFYFSSLYPAPYIEWYLC